ncbi:MAG: metalloregulator ArsR/SmtB family transcription factor [Lachnospiraceae bacterium]|nr:metalloregulator ArsR/SmtB family transcription factor [Lachnospiraceae bacterium]
MEQNEKRKIIPHDHGHGTMKLLEFMPSEKAFGEAADIFAQLSDATRLKILWILCHSEECVNDIAAAVDMSAPAVSHHLRNLRQSGFIRSRREGKEVLYRLEDTAAACLVHRMVDGVFQMKCPRTAHAMDWEFHDGEDSETSE